MDSEALKGLLYTPNDNEKIGETRSGVPVFSGDPAQLDEWVFRTKARVYAVDTTVDDHGAQALKSLASRIIEGLKGDALKVAMDMNQAELIDAAGVDKLIATMVREITPRKKTDARELYQEGSKLHGPLSRQRGESMSSYLLRRTRWWQKLQALDGATTVSENILADVTLNAARLSDTERQIAMSKLPDDLKMDDVKSTLKHLFPKKHLDETGKSDRGDGGKGRQPFRKFFRPGKSG